MLHLPLATNTSCPTWFYYSNSTQQCQCGYSMGLINCDQETQTVAIWDSYCVTYSGHRGQFYGGVCPMRHRKNRTSRVVVQLPTDPDLLNDVMWAPYNREGLLCGSCREGRAPQRGDPPEGGVCNAPDHSSSTWRLGERGFWPRSLLEHRWGRGTVVAMRSCWHQSVCKT